MPPILTGRNGVSIRNKMAKGLPGWGRNQGVGSLLPENKGQEKSRTSGTLKLILVMCMSPSQTVSESCFSTS